MLKSMYSAVTGVRSYQTMLDVIANNIANVNTAGFKASRVLFSDVYYQTLSSGTAPTTTAGGSNVNQLGSGTMVSNVDVLTTRGQYSPTDSPTDIYISGEGYFIIKDASGQVSYSRVGRLSFDAAGNLVDGSGNHVMGVNGSTGLPAYNPSSPIDLSSLSNITVANYSQYSSVGINSDGTITGIDATGATQNLGQIALATFTNPAGLLQAGSVYLQSTGNSGTPVIAAPGSAITGSFVTGGLEMSNVDLSKQLTDMIIAQRGFQANSRVVTTSDQVLEELVNLKR